MKRIAFLLIIITLFVSCNRSEKNDFEKHFTDKTLRINLIHTGDSSTESFKLDKIYDDGLWYGRTKNMVNPYRLGAYHYELRDVETDELLYSDGISTMFSEWRRTAAASKGKMSFNESIRVPYPIRNAKLMMYKIDTLDVMEPVWEYIIDRQTKSLMEPAKNNNNRIVRLLDSGDPKEKVDILIMGDGYTLNEIKRFDADVLHFYNSLISTEPFKSRKSDFNVHAIQVPPFGGHNSLGTKYGTFGHDRYALASDDWVIREFAAQAPYDYIIILMNDDKNGGGSLYNLYTTAAIRSQSDDYMIRHELGHQIVGLADKYYSNENIADTTEVSFYYYDFNALLNEILDLHTR